MFTQVFPQFQMSNQMTLERGGNGGFSEISIKTPSKRCNKNIHTDFDDWTSMFSICNQRNSVCPALDLIYNFILNRLIKFAVLLHFIEPFLCALLEVNGTNLDLLFF